MAKTVTVTIGGENIALPLIANFATLERIWPAMKALDATTDIVERGSARLAIISAVLKNDRPELTVPELKSRLRVDGFEEITGLIEPVRQMLVASGLIKEEAATAGEARPPAPPADTTDPTSNTSSQS